LKNKGSRRALNWIYKYTKGRLKWVAFLSVLTGMISFGFIWLAVVSKKVLDIATGDIEGSLWFACAEIIFIIALQAVMNILYSNIAIRALGKTDMAIKQGVFNALLEKKQSGLNEYHSGEIMNRFTSDTDIIVNGVIEIIPTAIALITRLIAGLWVLFAIDKMFTLVALGIGAFVFIAARIYSKHFKYLHKALQSANGNVRSFIQECFENIIAVKAFASDENVKKKLDEKQIKAYKILCKKQDVSNVANTGVYVLFTGGYYAALIWGALSISTGFITFGTLTAFLQIIEQIKAPMANISGLVPKFYSMLASAERLMELEELESEDRTVSENSDEIYKKLISVEFENVYFSYKKGEPVLRNASLSVKKGELVAISGPSGTGKSTLIKLLLDLAEPEGGRVYFKTTDSEITIKASHRKTFAYVPQGNLIFSGTIKENLCFCKPEATTEQITASLKAAMLYDFVCGLEKGIDTEIGERGLGLSEGQTQRLAVARAFLSDCPILLFDEATSALDGKNEEALINSIKKSGKTCIFISHRPQTLALCDRVEELKDGHFSCV